MFCVAICDDEEVLCSQLERVLEPYIEKEVLKVDIFYSDCHWMQCFCPDSAREKGWYPNMYYALALQEQSKPHDHVNQIPKCEVFKQSEGVVFMLW